MPHLFNAPRVLVFDSGVGGLSITREIKSLLPCAKLIYASDNAFFPYGTKAEAELITRVDYVIHELLKAYPADLLVIACNTASTLALPHLRARLSIPVVGVVPAIKPAALASKTKVVGLLATPATIARPYTHQLIADHAQNCKIISVGSSELVQIAEQKLRGEIVDINEIAKITQNFWHAENLDTLVLACTHFPLLREELIAALPPGLQLLDSGAAIARRVGFLLADSAEPPAGYIPEHLAPEHLAVFTQATKEAEQLAPALAGFGIYRQDYLQVET